MPGGGSISRSVRRDGAAGRPRWISTGGASEGGLRGRLDTRAGVYYRADLSISAPKDLIACRQFFLESTDPKQRQYEALRAYFVESRSSQSQHGALRRYVSGLLTDSRRKS